MFTPSEYIAKKIFVIRGLSVMLDSDLALLYQVKTMVLNQTVRRNIDRFPVDFMFQLNRKEYTNLISQIVISSREMHGGRRKLPYVFTEQGVAMLSSVLRSKRAIKMNIAIMRVFVEIRKILETESGLAEEIRKINVRVNKHEHKLEEIYRAIRRLLTHKVIDKKKKIGFKTDS